MQGAIWLHEDAKRSKQAEQVEKRASDAFVMMAAIKPRRYHAKFQRSSFEGPSARQEADDAERSWRILVLSQLLVGTPAAMGKLVLDKPGNAQLFGVGRAPGQSHASLSPLVGWGHVHRPVTQDGLSPCASFRAVQPRHA